MRDRNVLCSKDKANDQRLGTFSPILPVSGKRRVESRVNIWPGLHDEASIKICTYRVWGDLVCLASVILSLTLKELKIPCFHNMEATSFTPFFSKSSALEVIDWATPCPTSVLVICANQNPSVGCPTWEERVIESSDKAARQPQTSRDHVICHQDKTMCRSENKDYTEVKGA